MTNRSSNARGGENYAGRVINLLLQIELNRRDNKVAIEGKKIAYIIDADVVGYYIRPNDASGAGAGFRPADPNGELKQSILTGNYIFSGMLPGQGVDPLYIASAHAAEVSEMRAAIHRNLPGRGEKVTVPDPNDIRALHGNAISSLKLLSQVANKKVQPLERLALAYDTDLRHDFELWSAFHAAVERHQESHDHDGEALVNPARSRVGDMDRQQLRDRRDASALATATIMRDVITASDNDAEVLFISGSRHVHAAFSQVCRPSNGFNINDYWIRHPLQYAPYLNLATRANSQDPEELRFMFDGLEKVCRSALEDWKPALDTFEDILAVTHLSYLSSPPGNRFNILKSLWIAQLPDLLVKEEFLKLERHWSDVAKETADFLQSEIDSRSRELHSAILLHQEHADLELSRQALETLRMDSLRFDAMRDLSRSIFISKGRPDPTLFRSVHAPFEDVRGEGLRVKIRTVLEGSRKERLGGIDNLFQSLDSEPSETLLLFTAITALLSHNWTSARRWAREIATPGSVDSTMSWSLSEACPSVALRNAWLIRSIAARHSGFSTDEFAVLKRVWNIILSHSADSEPSRFRVAAESELIAVTLFATILRTFPPDGEVGKAIAGSTLGAPHFFDPDGAFALLNRLREVKLEVARIIELHPDNSDILSEVLKQLAINSTIISSLLKLSSRGNDENISAAPDLLDWGLDILEKFVRAESIDFPSVIGLARALGHIAKLENIAEARRIVRNWAKAIDTRHAISPVEFDLSLRKSLVSFGLID